MYPCLLVSPRDFVRESLQNTFGHLLEPFEKISDFLDFSLFFIVKSSFLEASMFMGFKYFSLCFSCPNYLNVSSEF